MSEVDYTKDLCDKCGAILAMSATDPHHKPDHECGVLDAFWRTISMNDKMKPAGRVFCSCGHEVQWHSQTEAPGRCLLQVAGGGECPCIKCVPTSVQVGPNAEIYRLVPWTATVDERAKGAENAKA